MSEPHLRLSRYLHWIPLDADRFALYHLHYGKLVDRETIALLSAFREPRTVSDVLAIHPEPDRIEPILRGFYERTFLVPADAHESAYHGARLREAVETGQGIGGSELRADAVRLETVESAAAAARLPDGPPMRLAIIGTCVWQELTAHIESAAAEAGLALQVSTEAEVDYFTRDGATVYDAVLVSPMALQRFLDAPKLGPVRDDVDAVLSSLSGYVSLLRAQTGSTVILHNFPAPAYPAGGLAEDQGADGQRALFRHIDDALRALCDGRGVVLFDWDQVAARHGRLRMQDGHLALYSHAGYPMHWLTDWQAATRDIAENPTILAVDPVEYRAHMGLDDPHFTHHRMAEELVTFLSVLFRARPKKVIAVDLDGTLWPGVLAEQNHVLHAEWDPNGETALWAGIHQALKNLRRQGVLLITCSKNDPEVILPQWRALTLDPWRARWMLTPDDFVAHAIGWERKSVALQRLSTELNLGLDSFVFIDDHPVERAEISHVLPDVEVYDGPMFGVRRYLSSHPGFQALAVSTEAAERTEMTRGQLARDQAQSEAPSLARFFDELAVSVTVRRENNHDRIARIHELLTRTNQLNSRCRRYTAAEVETLVDERRVFTATTEDRFVAYGLTAVAVLADDQIIHLAASCRTNGLGVERAFLGAIANSTGIEVLEIPFERTAKNRPLFDLLEALGSAHEDGYHVMREALDAGHITLTGP